MKLKIWATELTQFIRLYLTFLNIVEKLTRPLFKHSLDVMDLMKGTEDRDGKLSSMLQCLKCFDHLHFFFLQHKPR